MTKAERAWKAALGQLQVDMSKANFDTWVRDAELISYEDGLFIIGVPNAYARDWLDSRLSSTIVRLLTGMMGRTVEVSITVWQNIEENQSLAIPELVNIKPNLQTCSTSPTLNSKYSFDNFVVGTSNRLAHAASMAVADKPAHAYNPLFLYGGVGLGKTHLLHAIGNQCHQTGLKVLYVSSEEFTNDLINGIRLHDTQGFRDKYRQIDVLLIDDIQFIAGKESTQEEFFHTFNTLHRHNKQIVISSDRSPKASMTLEERLRSRFEWGLIADIQPPDFETRQAILRSKAEQAGRQISNEILEVIARLVQSNIRELEGTLTRVYAYAEMSGLPLTRQLVETAVADLLPRYTKLEPENIIRVVADVFGVSVERMLSRERSQEVAFPRQIAMYLMREQANISLPNIGKALGGRDHTTVMYGCEKVGELIEEDDHLRGQVVKIRERLQR